MSAGWAGGSGGAVSRAGGRESEKRESCWGRWGCVGRGWVACEGRDPAASAVAEDAGLVWGLDGVVWVCVARPMPAGVGTALTPRSASVWRCCLRIRAGSGVGMVSEFTARGWVESWFGT